MLRRAVLRLAHGALAPERTAVCWRLPPVRCLADSPARVEPSAPQPAVRRPEPARGVGQAGAARQRALKISELLTKARSPVQVLEVVGSARADFNSINLATALHRIAKLTAAQPSAERRTFFHAHDERMRRLVADIHAELPRFPGRQLAACAYAASLICHGPSQPLRDDVRLLLRAIGPLAVRHVPDLHSQGLANLAWAHAQADMHAPELFDALTPVALRRLPEFSIEGLSALAWAYAKLGLPEPALVRALGRQVVGRLAAREGPHDRPARAERTSPREITNLAWSLSRLAGPSEELRGAFDALAADALRQLQHFHPRDLSQLVWTYARARHAAPELFERVAALALPRLSQFNSQDFANMASAYAIAGVDADWLFRAVALEVEPRLHEFTPQGLANLAWAFSKAGTPSARVLLESIATVFPARLPELGARHLAMLVWAFAKSGVYPEAPFRAVETELGARNLSGFNHIELVNTAWAFATARVAAPALLELIGAELLPRLGQLEPQPLANIAWSLARSRTPAHAVFRAICDEVERRPLHTFSAQNQANLAWAFAVAGCEGPRLAAALAPEIVSRAAEFKGAELANLAWALSVCRALGSAQLAPASRRQLAGALLQRIELLRDAPEVRAPPTPAALVPCGWRQARYGHAHCAAALRLALHARRPRSSRLALPLPPRARLCGSASSAAQRRSASCTRPTWRCSSRRPSSGSASRRPWARGARAR